MIRQIIKIDEEKCNGCGACASACHEGAIAIIGGKAKLIRDDYCDGMGDCLPECPTGAISFENREAAAYDEKAVADNKKRMQAHITGDHKGGCPGSKIMELKLRDAEMKSDCDTRFSELKNWPVQIKLAPINAPYFNGADLLIAADCTSYAFASMHDKFMKGRITLIGCPKLDGVNYSEKISEIFKQNNIESITVVRMEVPCCGGLEMAVKNAVSSSGKIIPCNVVTISIDGNII